MTTSVSSLRRTPSPLFRFKNTKARVSKIKIKKSVLSDPYTLCYFVYLRNYVGL